MRVRSFKKGVAAVAAAVLAVALGAAPAPALAEDGTVVTDATTLQAALDDANVRIITLGDDVTYSMTVPAGRTVTLDLNGHTLTNDSGKHTITNNGALTITGQGTVDNVSHACAALYNDGGDATIAGGTFTRSAEAGTPGVANGNSWYVVNNESGSLKMSGGTVSGKSGFSSCFRNGGTMDFTGGTIEQPVMIGLKNEGTLVMDGGKVVSSNGFQNWGTATIKSGEIDGLVTNLSYDDSTPGSLKVAGGSISGDVVVVKYSGATTTPSLNVTGGYVAGTITATAGTTVNPELNTPSDEVAANVTIDGGTFADASSNARFVSLNAAMLRSGDSFKVVNMADAIAGSTSAVNVGNAKVYFADADAARDFAKESGLDGSAVERVNYVVSFETNGHGSVDSVTVRSGSALGTLPEVPAVEGYTAAGWYVGDQKVDETYVPTSDVTLVAKWTKNATQSNGSADAGNTGAGNASNANASNAGGKVLPQTGDTNKVTMMVAIAVVGVIAVAGAIFARRHNN